MLTNYLIHHLISISLEVPNSPIERRDKGGNSHSLDEWWINENEAEAIKFALLILIAEAGLVE